ncbi:hypothetical protein ACFWZT_31030 [Streptomyces alboflavus]|uniref:hypothetical protein n=1 Tax=Streptomyces alboflavus TaxID=67267 RepID=UPI003695D79E
MDREVLARLLNVIQYGLCIPPDDHDPDEGRAGMYLWRRGLTKTERRELRKAEAEGRDLDEGPGKHPWQYVIVYRQFTDSECIRYHKPRSAIVVERFLGETDLAQGFLSSGH